MYRLLIVDKDREMCEKIRHLLDWSRYGFDCVIITTSYAEAVSKAIDFQPHVAIAEVELGDQWGYDLAAHLRSLGIKTVFCMIASHETPQYMRKSMQACAQDYLLKPVSAHQMRSFIERVIVNELHGTLPERAAARPEIDPVVQIEYSRFSKITNKIILYVKSNYHHCPSLTTIAESFRMSSKYMGRVFQKDTGIKYTEYLMAYRLLEARRLIVSTQEKISVIAGMVGFSQLNNFYTQFRNYFGVSPSSLRHFEEDGIHAEEAAVSL